MMTVLVCAVAIGMCLAMGVVKPPQNLRLGGGGGGGKDPNDRKDLKDHGNELKEKVTGKKCPHCGKPI